MKHEIVGKFDISLPETFLSMESSTKFEILGFHPLFRRDGGGVACYVRYNLVAKKKEK